MVQDAKMVALNITDPKAVSCWRSSNKAVSYQKCMLMYIV